MLTPVQITHAPAGTWIGNEYASVDPFSLDCKHLLLVHHDHFELYDGSGKWLSKLPPFISASSEPRWSRTDAHVLYYVSGNELREFDVRTEKSDLVRKFAGSRVIKGRGESDISDDGDHIVLSDDKGQVWVYNLKSDQVTNSYLYTQPFNSLYIAPDNSIVMGTDRGVFAYGILGWSDERQLAPTISHMDVGRDQNGREILIRTNSADPEPLANCPNGIENVDIRTGERKCILPIDWTYAIHVSCPAQSDRFILSTFSPTNSKPSQVLQVKYGGSGSTVLCDTGTVMFKTQDGTSYNPQPKASVSRDGSRLVFSSNSGDTSRGPDYCDTFLLMLEEKEAPKPQPERPIVVTPQPDLTTELAALRQQLSEAQSWAASRQKFISQLEDESVRLVGLLTRTEEQRRTAEQQVQMLTDALASMRADTVDPEVWAPIHRKPRPGVPLLKWGIDTLESGLVQMNDVDPETGKWTPVKDTPRNTYLLVKAEEPGYEMYARRTNK